MAGGGKGILAGVGALIVYGYTFGVMIFTPYYNWQFAQKHGFWAWLTFGQVVPTMQAAVWPWFLAQDTLFAKKPDPEMNAEESAIYNGVFQKATMEELTDSDISTLRGVVSRYQTRTGATITKEQHAVLVAALDASSIYLKELSNSALQSWDAREVRTTAGYGAALEGMQRMRSKEQLDLDVAMLNAAANNQAYLEDFRGRKFEFGRSIIESKILNASLQKRNMETLKNVLAEYVQ